MATVWVVEQGVYSDYRVVAIFSTEARAAALCAVIGGDASYRPRALDPPVPEPGLWPYQVIMGRTGDHASAYRIGLDEDCAGWGRLDPDQFSAYWVYGKTEPYLYGRFHTQMMARDQDHAIKIANERRLAKIAAGEWPEETS